MTKVIIREITQSIFKEIAECFARHKFTFKFALDFGEYKGKTTPTSSGVYIEIDHYLENNYMIKLEQTNVQGPSYDQRARRVIHEHIAQKLICSKCSPDSRYFLRWPLPSLREIGIEQVVTSWVTVHQQYDKIWCELEAQGVQARMAELLESFDTKNAQIMRSVDVVIDDQHLQGASMETEVAAP
ncbi:MAG: hypothetical protein V4699_01255 [Patescibacteria group bacterium]